MVETFTRAHTADRLLVTPEEFASSRAAQNLSGVDHPDDVEAALLTAQNRLSDLLGFDVAAHYAWDLDALGEPALDAAGLPALVVRGWRAPGQTLGDLRAIPAEAFGLDPALGPPLAALDALPPQAPPHVLAGLRLGAAVVFGVEGSGDPGVQTTTTELGPGEVQTVRRAPLETLDAVLLRYAGHGRQPAT